MHDDALKPKMEVPNRLGLAVLVCEVRTGGVLWPLTRYDKPEAGPMRVTSGRGKSPQGLDVLREAAELCLATCCEIAGRDRVTVAAPVEEVWMRGLAAEPEIQEPHKDKGDGVDLVDGAEAGEAQPVATKGGSEA